MVFDQFSEPEALVKFTHEDQAAVRGDARPMEIDLQSRVQGKLKRLILFLTHWVWPSRRG
jgi:hypothetical protein